MKLTDQSPSTTNDNLVEGITFFPIKHGSLPFSISLRDVFFRVQPTVVCLELPASLEREINACLQELPQLHFIFCQLQQHHSILSFTPDPADARIEALRLALMAGIDVCFADLDEGAAEEIYQLQPDERAIQTIIQTSPEAYTKALLVDDPTTYTPYRRVQGIVHQLNSLKGERVLFVGHAFLIPPIVRLLKHQAEKGIQSTAIESWNRIQRTQIVAVQANQLPFALAELPALVAASEEFKSSHDDNESFDLEAALIEFIRQAISQYEQETHETISLGDQRAFFKYVRNLTLLNNKLRPGLYELVTAAKGCMDDDFAVILLEILTRYPPCGEDERTLSERYQSLSLYHEFDSDSGRQLCTPLYPRPNLKTLEFQFKKRKQASAQQRELWKELYWLMSDGGICTWPAESIREENFFERIRERALQQLTDEHRTTEEFQTSLHDGLDIRETIRNWHTGKIYVKKERRPPGQVGALVVVWEDKPLNDPDCWNVTLYSENEHESDISFCATPLGQEVVGPQISLSYYNCILSVFPAQSIPDVWQEEILQDWGMCSRLLIAAGILLSEEKFITVVAPHPPDQELRQFAKENKKALLYLPLQTFGRKTLKAMRRFHVLSSRNARLWGGDYIEE